MNDLVVSRGTSMLSIRCSSSAVPSVTATSACVCAAGEERRAVGPGQQAGLDGDRPDGVRVAPVDPLALVEHLGPHDAVFDFLDLVADGPAGVGELGRQLSRSRPT